MNLKQPKKCISSHINKPQELTETRPMRESSKVRIHKMHSSEGTEPTGTQNKQDKNDEHTKG